MSAIYSLLLTVVAILTAPYWIIKGLRQRKYFGTITQRMSRDLPEISITERPIWIHAVSVGEVLAAKVLLGVLRTERPELPIVISTVTVTGQTLARRELRDAAAHFYFPFDWAFCVRRFLRKVAPRCVVLLETEMWPNFLEGCARLGVPVIIANGRISDKSFDRYKYVHWLTSSMLSRVRLVGAQTEEDRLRFIQLGAPEDRVRVTGNLKFDFAAPDLSSRRELLSAVSRALRLRDGDPLIVIGSTMKGEEPLFLQAYSSVKKTFPRARMILAPRHPERFGEVADLLRSSGTPFLRRSELDQPLAAPPDILLLDTVGELRQVYSLASIAVIGGSFLPFGGHNPLEPAALAKPVVFGPDMSNFREVARLFLSAGAARQCSIDGLAGMLTGLLSDDKTLQALGEKAAATLRRNQGAALDTTRFILSELR